MSSVRLWVSLCTERCQLLLPLIAMRDVGSCLRDPKIARGRITSNYRKRPDCFGLVNYIIRLELLANESLPAESKTFD